MTKTANTAAAIIKGTVAHWKKEISSAKTQIASGAYPQYDKNCRRYIKECRSYIRKAKA